MRIGVMPIIVKFEKYGRPRYYMSGDYMQYVRFADKEKEGEVLNEKHFQEPSYNMLPALESFNSNEVDEPTTKKTTQSLSNIQISILEYIQNHHNASRKEISASLCDITEDGMKYHLRKLQKQGFIKRIGPDKGGLLGYYGCPLTS